MVKQNKNTEWNSLKTKLKVFSCVTISSIYQPNKDQGTGVLINHLHCVKQPTVPIWPSYLYTGQLKQHLTTQSQAWRNDLGLKGTYCLALKCHLSMLSGDTARLAEILQYLVPLKAGGRSVYRQSQQLCSPHCYPFETCPCATVGYKRPHVKPDS